MKDHTEGRDDDLEVPPDRPAAQIFEVRLEPVCEVVAMDGRAAEAADLCETRHPRLHRVAVEIAVVDLPEDIVLGGRAKRVRARTDDTHMPEDDVDELWQLVEAGSADELADASHPFVGPTRRAHAGRVRARVC